MKTFNLNKQGTRVSFLTLHSFSSRRNRRGLPDLSRRLKQSNKSPKWELRNDDSLSQFCSSPFSEFSHFQTRGRSMKNALLSSILLLMLFVAGPVKAKEKFKIRTSKNTQFINRAIEVDIDKKEMTINTIAENTSSKTMNLKTKIIIRNNRRKKMSEFTVRNGILPSSKVNITSDVTTLPKGSYTAIIVFRIDNKTTLSKREYFSIYN